MSISLYAYFKKCGGEKMGKEAKKLGDTLKKARINKNLKQEDIARFLGKSVPTISCYENGTKAISVENLKRVCNLLGIEMNSI